MPQWPNMISGLTNGSGHAPTLTGPPNSAAWSNFPPMTTGIAALNSPIVAPMAGVRRPAINVGGNWIPQPSEYQIWIAPAGWAEAAYLNGEKIDGEDPLSFLDRLEGVEEINIRCEQKTREILVSGCMIERIPDKPAVYLTFSHDIVIEKSDKYSDLFPEGETRDVIIQACKPVTERNGRERLRTARAIIANVVLKEREVNIFSTGNTHETIVLVGDGYFPIVEQK